MDAYAIIYGLFHKQSETIEYLKANPSVINAKTKLDETPLHFCVIENRIDLAIELITIGADVNCVDFSGNSPLIHAIQLSYSDMIELLIMSGADFNIKNCCDETALSFVVKKKNKKLLEYLLGRLDHGIQFYFSGVDAMEIFDDPDDEIHKALISKGLRNPFDA